MPKGTQTHFSLDSKTAACGSGTDPNWFSPVPDEVTCKRCQKSYIYMETVDALTRPEGAAPRYTRPIYAISKEKLASIKENHSEDSPEYQKAVKEITEKANISALRNAKAQVIEEAREKEPVYELSYTIVSHKVRQSELLDTMETLLNFKATNIKLVQM